MASLVAILSAVGGGEALCGMVVALSSLRMAAYVPQSLATGNVVGGFLSPMFWGVWIAPTFIFLLWMGTETALRWKW